MQDLICPTCERPTKQLFHLERFCPNDCDKKAAPSVIEEKSGAFQVGDRVRHRSLTDLRGKILKLYPNGEFRVKWEAGNMVGQICTDPERDLLPDKFERGDKIRAIKNDSGCAYSVGDPFYVISQINPLPALGYDLTLANNEQDLADDKKSCYGKVSDFELLG